jgi:diguanylate cyclase
LIVSYNPWLVAASIVVAIMASFTGLRLASGLRMLARDRCKVQITKAAFALGGGIWSMHFVAMLALHLPVAIGYDALYTLGSVLIAILITGIGLTLMFVGERTLSRTVAAGTLTGVGIVAMHYFGTGAISGLCRVSYVPSGFFISIAIAVLFSICALRLAYGRRTLVQLSLGALVLGITISGMHYSAMAFTRFTETANAGFVSAPVIQADYLALIVALATFVVCGLFLLTALPLEASLLEIDNDDAATTVSDEDRAAKAPPVLDEALLLEWVEPRRNNEEAGRVASREPMRLPYEQHNATYFIDADRVQAIKADGHYTLLYDGEETFFCPWSISKVETFLAGQSFLRTHRSFLVNIRHARAFQRKKDKAYLIVPALQERMVPVSRFHLPEVRRALGM